MQLLIQTNKKFPEYPDIPQERRQMTSIKDLHLWKFTFNAWPSYLELE